MTHSTKWLRAESLALAAAFIVAYAATDGSWLLFAALFLVPDLSMLGYLAGPGAGALAYNAVHAYLGPLVLVAVALHGGAGGLLAPALIWGAHIAIDRVLGYGLKEPDAFRHTHLGWVGGAPEPGSEPES